VCFAFICGFGIWFLAKELYGVWWKKNITSNRKKMVYNSMVKSVLIYGAETWSLYEDDRRRINPLNAELYPIYHLLILLGYLTFMGKCIVSISNKMQRYTVYLYLETALHVSGGTSTDHQERIQLYLQHLVFVTPLLLSAANVEELEPV
jgi:hypothetical protein